MSACTATPTMRVCATLLEQVSGRNDAATPYDSPRGAPTLPLSDYLARWTHYTETGDAEVLCAVVYIDRVCTRTGLILTRRNVHRVVLSAILAATKWREDHPFKMSHYAKVGGVRPEELRALELRWMMDLDWQTFVDASLKEKYELKFRRHPVWQVTRSNGVGSIAWSQAADAAEACVARG